jgi:outer membrane lipoprotein-sorting protein
MRPTLSIMLGLVCCAAFSAGQTADELVAKNLQAKGGIEKIKAITTQVSTGKLQQGQFQARVGQEAKAPDLMRQTFTIQGMTAIQAYDGNTGWQISPFEGRKDPELLGEDDLRDIVEQADFYGPLVDYKEKGNTIDYLGHDSVDGDDVYKLRVTLKNGDILNYYLDPDSMLEIRVEKIMYIRGAVHESVQDLGSYKQVNGVYFPFSMENGQKNSPQRSKITIDSLKVNVPIEDSQFKMPAAPALPSPQKHEEPTEQKKVQPKPPEAKKPPKN